MKRFLISLIVFFFLTGSALSGEYNIPFWQSDDKVNTFISILNPSSVSVEVEITVKNSKGCVIHREDNSIPPGQAWYFDTVHKSLNGFGTINIFCDDTTMRNDVVITVPLAIAAMIYGQHNMSVQVWKY